MNTDFEANSLHEFKMEPNQELNMAEPFQFENGFNIDKNADLLNDPSDDELLSDI